MAIDYLQGARLQFVGLHYETSLYELHGPQFTNRYYILSGAGTRQLMAFPEVVGFDSYQAMLPATVAALRLLFPGAGGDVDILTILRGGLNYPVEEACARNGIRVRDIHFVSCVLNFLPVFRLRRECAFAHANIRFKRNYAILRVQIYNNYFI